jgi:broad specificity phosphatase PhoE
VIELVYETHAISTDNERGIATGWLQGELSERGRELARELGRRRRDDGLAAVFASDLRRAVETAELAFAGTEIPIRQDERLRECDYGDLNGGPAAEVAATKLSRIDTPFPNGESYVDVVERTRGFLADLIEEQFEWQPGWEYELRPAATIL